MEVAELWSMPIIASVILSRIPNTTPAMELSSPRESSNHVPTPSSRFQCPECQQTFGRVEHLTRHSRSHMKERYLKCPVCRKGFYRIDALRRHEKIHQETRRSALAKGSRACLSCAAARRKCSGDTPSCSGCQKRSLECKYPGSLRTMEFDSCIPRVMHEANTNAAQAPLAVQSLEQEGQHIQSVTPETNMDIDLADSSSWLQSTFSSINWLPGDWTPDFQMESAESLGTFDQDSSMILRKDANTVENNDLRLHGASHELRQKGLTPRPGQLADGQELLSPASHSTQSGGGHYYVDGDGARLPRVGKAPYRHSGSYTHAFLHDNNKSQSTFAFPESESYRDDLSTSDSHNTISPEVYSELFRLFNCTCVSSTHYSNFQGAYFLSSQTLELFLDHYEMNFQSILPFIHPSTFDVSKTHWQLILAMAAIGSHYNDSPGAESITVALHEFLRRVILTVVETEGSSKPDLLILTQVRLLSCVGMIYSGDERLKGLAMGAQSDLASFCKEYWGKLSECPPLLSDNPDQITTNWQTWCKAESSRRTGYCIWLLDCMWAFQFQMRPALSLEDAKIPIPSQEVLWEADSAMDWQQLYSCATPSPSLHSAIQLAYVEKRIQSSTGEFSRILCIHAIFRRTWEVENYFKQPLTLWTPTAEKQNITTIENSMPIWLPGIPAYSVWRNSACDCLDILHWHANSVIGAASGMEHPTVLHLHLARVILLTPHRQILQLAQLMTSQIQPHDEVDIPTLQTQLQRWAFEDQHKARLAMIHAGALFWHVRRFSTDAFYEASSVFLATLALWAYGTFAAPTSGVSAQRDGESPQADDEDAESLFPTSMQLDRPADDELVQLFVKRGASMRANITGVGNLCSAKGPGRVLIEGRNLLAGLKVWGYNRQAIRTLSALIEMPRPDGPAG